MKYETLTNYSEEDFRRITGVKRSTFETMLQILEEANAVKHKKGGRKSKLGLHNMLLAAFEYWREYRTYAHIGASYGINESNVYRSIKWIEDTLIKNGTFSIPGKKALLKCDCEYETVLIDATENAIERPKKNRKNIIRVRKNATL